jgi:hypothetical protein
MFYTITNIVESGVKHNKTQPNLHFWYPQYMWVKISTDIQWKLSKPNFLETNFCVRNRQVFYFMDKLYHIMLYRVRLTWTRFEHTTLVVICTDCIGSYKLNYHTITTTTAPQKCNHLFYNLSFILETTNRHHHINWSKSQTDYAVLKILLCQNRNNILSSGYILSIWP